MYSTTEYVTDRTTSTDVVTALSMTATTTILTDYSATTTENIARLTKTEAVITAASVEPIMKHGSVTSIIIDIFSLQKLVFLKRRQNYYPY